MDPLSITASTIAILQLTTSIISFCYGYQDALKDAPKDIRTITGELNSLQDILCRLLELVHFPRMQTLASLDRPDGELLTCRNELEALKKKLETINSRKALGKTIFWPLKKGDVDKILAVLQRCKATLNLALNTDQAAIGLATHDIVVDMKEDVTIVKERVAVVGGGVAAVQNTVVAMNSDVVETKEGVASVQDTVTRIEDGVTSLANATEKKGKGLYDALNLISEAQTYIHLDEEELRGKIYHWLAPPDTSYRHITSLEKRLPGTGEWFLRRDQFTYWQTDAGSFLWLQGIVGCGKTVLCSTIIEHISNRCKSNSSCALVYFYFEFRNQDGHMAFLRSLIKQLCAQYDEVPEALEKLHSDHDKGERQPGKNSLMATLKTMLEGFEHVYIVIDALDECWNRDTVLPIIKEIVGWELQGLHMLATSRKERDIEEALAPLVTDQVCAESALVDSDIRIYVQNASWLETWPEDKDEIEKTLVEGAHGMFQWVVCQMEVLRKCQSSSQLRKMLKSLPENLDETYNRILEAIDNVNVEYAYKVLQWLAYSARPVKLEEVTEALAVDLDKSKFDPAERLRDQAILNICSSLVTISKTTISHRPHKTEECYVLTLAHFSVKEYLLSDYIRNSRPKVSRFSICKEDADVLMAQTCLIYLLQFNHLQYTNWTRGDKNFPLARYSARYWAKHAQSWGPNAAKALEGLVLKLLQPAEAHYVNWNRFYQADLPHKDELDREVGTLATPLYYMSFVGLTEISRTLLDQGADVNARGGHYNNPLQAASCQGHDGVVQLLLSYKANVNAWGGRHGTALHAAAYNGSEAVARLLIKDGADVSAEGSGPLKASKLPPAQFQWLALMTGINLDGGHHPSVLEVAADRGHEKIVQLLLEKGAKVTVGEGFFGNALVAAAFARREDIVRQLLDAGADVNAKGGHVGSALQVASKRHDESMVKLLLERGAK